ncbi:hypothetical protein V5F89_12335 [Pelagerythrobacter marensis]|uniref:Transcriptional regulator n=1 Tax=Pelagerythrobacter marensis TaxID=543877 RepID=A0ABZ2D3X8_9SPHN
MVNAAPQSPAMSPGTYIRKRRTMAGVSVAQASGALAALEILAHRTVRGRIGQLQQRLAAAEADRDHFTLCEAQILRNVFPFDPNVYEQLVDFHLAGPGAALPEPQICRNCACSYFDACMGTDGPCAWHSDDLCTVCANTGGAEHVNRHRPLRLIAESTMETA